MVPYSLGPNDDLAQLCAESVIVFGLDGTIRAWNASAARLYGWDASHAFGENIDTLLASPAHGPHLMARVRVLTDGGWSGRLQRRAADGQEHVVRALDVEVALNDLVREVLPMDRGEAMAT
jgi:PAS domain S-box-containing protein